MNNKVIFGIVVIILVVVGAVFLNKKGLYLSPPSTEGTPEAVGGNAVTIQNFAFALATLTVKAGTTVTWTSQDSATHNIKSDTFNSPEIAQDGTFSFTFNDKGSFDYICGIHPTMQGKIIVE